MLQLFPSPSPQNSCSKADFLLYLSQHRPDQQDACLNSPPDRFRDHSSAPRNWVAQPSRLFFWASRPEIPFLPSGQTKRKLCAMNTISRTETAKTVHHARPESLRSLAFLQFNLSLLPIPASRLAVKNLANFTVAST
jgi:hypothetical protein